VSPKSKKLATKKNSGRKITDRLCSKEFVPLRRERSPQIVARKPKRLREERKEAKASVKQSLKSSRASKRSDAPTVAATEDESEQKTLPLLFIDIHLDDKDVHRLTIHEGDSPESLADDFCHQFNIDGEMKEKLTELIKTQMDTLLTRIDEAEEDEV
jgi:hypothetical protein